MCWLFIFKDTEPSPLQDSFSVRQQGGLPGPPPVSRNSELNCTARCFISRGPVNLCRGMVVRLSSRLLGVADWLVVFAAETLKAWIREVFRLCQQLVLAFSAV